MSVKKFIVMIEDKPSMGPATSSTMMVLQNVRVTGPSGVVYQLGGLVEDQPLLGQIRDWIRDYYLTGGCHGWVSKYYGESNEHASVEIIEYEFE